MSTIHPKKIFVVDDDPMIAELLIDYLSERGGHSVTVFSTGEDCLGQLDENPDIIILDYYLNSVKKDAADGMVILQFIKLNYPQVKIIMLSSLEKHRTVEQIVEHGAQQFVFKDEHAFEKLAKLVNG